MIKYIRGMKYQLVETYEIQTDVTGFACVGQFIILTKDGYLIIKKGFAWNGCSGPTWDDKTNMEGSLVHDAAYLLIRQSAIPNKYRNYIDKLFKDICISKGMNKIRAWYYLQALKLFGKYGSNPKKRRKVIVC